MDETWHARPRGSATRAHATPTRRYIYLYIYNLYIGSAFCISEGNINSLNTTLLINSIMFFNFSRVGLSPTVYFGRR